MPYVGKRWVHQLEEYDRERGISYWTKNYRTALEAGDPGALIRVYEYYDPIGTLPSGGQAWWRQHAGREPGEAMTAGHALAAASRPPLPPSGSRVLLRFVQLRRYRP